MLRKTREDGGEVWAANYNSPMQTVIAGRADSADAVCEMLSARGAKKIIPLPVSVPSHCPLMQPAADALLPLLESIPWRAPSPPVLHNAILDVAAPADIPAALAAQLVRPVRWTETIAAMTKADIAQAYECGPGRNPNRPRPPHPQRPAPHRPRPLRRFGRPAKQLTYIFNAMKRFFLSLAAVFSLAMPSALAAGDCPLCEAAASGDATEIRRLLAEGANPNAAGANPEARVKEGWTALMSAAQKGHAEAARNAFGRQSGY